MDDCLVLSKQIACGSRRKPSKSGAKASESSLRLSLRDDLSTKLVDKQILQATNHEMILQKTLVSTFIQSIVTTYHLNESDTKMWLRNLVVACWFAILKGF